MRFVIIVVHESQDKLQEDGCYFLWEALWNHPDIKPTLVCPEDHTDWFTKLDEIV